jgi:2-polyprenyl-3-methyl-5-hydroxy-6-metoxy-1,4-benzoquinol methylase
MIREKVILRLIKDKDVLDIGSVGQSQKYHLWSKIKKNSRSLIGIDTEFSNEKDIVQGNMENYSFRKKFDVIIAGDVIEHVYNQGLFLLNIRSHLKDNGTLIITTPNAKWFTVIKKPNSTHTLWHDKYTLKYILKMTGFNISFFSFYYGNKPYYNFIKKILAFRQSMLLVCKVNK